MLSNLFAYHLQSAQQDQVPDLNTLLKKLPKFSMDYNSQKKQQQKTDII